MIVFFAWSRYLWRDREIAPTFAKKFDICFTVILQIAPLPSRLTAAMENDIIAAIYYYHHLTASFPGQPG